MLYGKKSLSPQKTPRRTEYTDVKISPGKTTKKILRHLSSENKKEKCGVKIKNIKHTGTATARVKVSPAVITFCARSLSPLARYLVISLDTVIGVPEEQKVKSSANTDSAT